jgi:hypothetical protein
LSTLQRVYQIIAAQLYRAETRSAVAEEAWAIATGGDPDEPDLPDAAVAGKVRAARARAVAIIVDGNHPPVLTESAIDTLDHALYTATAGTDFESMAGPSQGALHDRPRRGPRL